MGTSKETTLQALAELTQSELIGDPHYCISGIEALDEASEKDASFLANPRYKELLKQTKAGVVCIDRTTPLIEGKNYLISDNPSSCFQKIAEYILPYSHIGTQFTGIHETAVIHPTAKMGKNVSIGPYVTIDAHVVIGDGTILYPFVYIGCYVNIGEACQIHAHATVREGSILGNRVILQPGVVIGSCGFGYLTDKDGSHTKLQQLGNVIIEDDVEIGANTTIDRSRFKSTKIGQGTKIDNLVQIGHNVVIGENNLIVSQTGIAGSTKTGKRVVIGGQVGIVGHIEITSDVMIAARGGVSKSITKKGRYAGTPVMDLSEYNRQKVLSRNIAKYVQEIEELKKRLQELESQISQTL